MKEYKAAGMIVAAGTLWGLIALFVRMLTAAGMGALTVVCYRNVLAALLLGAWLVLRDKRMLRIRLRDVWIFLGTGIVSIALFNLCYFITLSHTSVAVAALLLYTSPVFVMLLAFALFHEPLTWKKLLALVLTVVGCACVTGVFSESETVQPLYIITGLGSGLFYGLYSIFGKAALRRYSTETVTFYTFLFAAIATIPFVGKDCVQMVLAQPTLLLIGSGLALFCTVLPFQLYTRGLDGVTAGRAAILATAEPIVGTVLGIVAFGDQLSVWTVLGIFLIVTAIVLMNTKRQEACYG